MPGCLAARVGQAGGKDTSMNPTCAFCPEGIRMALVGVSLCVFMSVSICVRGGKCRGAGCGSCWRKKGRWRMKDGGVSEYLREEGMSDGGGHV